MSSISGILYKVTGSSLRIAVAIIGKAAFFEPDAFTLPYSLLPPLIM